MSTTSEPNGLFAAWQALRREEPQLFTRDAAARLGVSEAELVGSCVGRGASPLAPRFTEIFLRLPELGRVKTMTRNAVCVLEKWGAFESVALDGHIGQTVGEDIDTRLFPSRWRSLFHLVEQGPRGERSSLQLFDQLGESVIKIYREPESNAAAWDALVAAFATDITTEPLASRAPAAAPGQADSEVDVAAFRTAWDAMTDTHEFFGLLRRYQLGRLQALRLAGADRARPVGRDALERVLEGAARSGERVMVFVGNRGLLQIHSGPLHTVRRTHGFLNVLDPGFNLHVREEAVAGNWVVRKPTSDGVVTSLELFDEQGENVALLFGKRQPGEPEPAWWRALALGLPSEM